MCQKYFDIINYYFYYCAEIVITIMITAITTVIAITSLINCTNPNFPNKQTNKQNCKVNDHGTTIVKELLVLQTLDFSILLEKQCL